MSIDTNAPYKVPEKYKAKKTDFVPKTKPTSVVMIIIGGIIICAITIAGIIGIIIGANIVYKSARDAINQPEQEQELDENVNRA